MMTKHAKASPSAGSLLTVLVTVAALMSAGCLETRQPHRNIDIYSPIYDLPAATGQAPLAAIIRIDHFGIAPELNTARMAYSEAPHKLDYYNYHQWQANPADMVSYYLARDLRATGQFAGVIVPGSGIQPSHRIEGVVDRFQEVDDRDGQWYSEMAVTITLVRDKEVDVSRRIVFQKRYEHRERLPQRSPEGLAAGMSRCMAVISEMIAADVYGHLKPA